MTTMLSRHNFDALLTLGDHLGAAGRSERLVDQYERTYGAYDDRVRPTPGDQDYATADAAGYFDYFERNSPTFTGDPYYAFWLGGWRIYSLNSEIGGTEPGGDMYEWLRNDLGAHPTGCVLAYWHRPMLTVGPRTNDEGGMALIWALLAAHGADIVLAAHDRNYQRWEPINGITSFVVGTGGRSRDPISRDDERLAFTDADHFGALELTLRARGASYAFRSAGDRVLDSGDLACRQPIADAGPPEAPAALQVGSQANGIRRLTWDPPGNAADVMGYVVQRGRNVIGYTTETTFDDTSLPVDAGVLYSVRAVNASGLRSVAGPSSYSGGVAIGFSGHEWSALDMNPGSPTRDKPQSKVWLADSTWWGILYSDGRADGVRPGHYIYRLDTEAETMVNTEVAADPRDRSHADVLWDEITQRLYVVSASDSGAVRLYRYGYATGQYFADPGFPVSLTENGSETVTIARASSGRLWVTLTQPPDGSGRCVDDKPCSVRVMHSTTTDARWTDPINLPADGAEIEADDVSSVVAYGSRVGILWSNQLDGSFRFASHADGEADTEWSTEVLIVSPRASDDHLNVKADDAGRVYFVGKTSLNDPSDAPGESPLVSVWVRETNGEWRSATAWTVADDVTRPQLVVDQTLDQVAVVAAAPGRGGAIYAKTAAIETLGFDPGLGTPLMLGVSLNNPTTTKQPVDLARGVLVLAGDTATHTYWHNRLSIPR